MPPMNLGTMIRCIFRRVWGFHSLLTKSDLRFDSKLADAGNPLVKQLGRYLH